MEMIISILIFSVFLFAVFAIMNFALKNYRLIDTKGEAQSQSEVALGRIVSDLIATDISSLVTGTAQEEYLVFETAIDPATHKFQKDMKQPVWKGYVLYYTYPRDPNSEDKELFRKFIPHEDRTLAKEMTNVALYLNDTYNEFAGEELRTVARSIYDLQVELNSTNIYMVDISLTTWKSFSEKRLAYEKDFSDTVAQETVTLKISVVPRNSRD